MERTGERLKSQILLSVSETTLGASVALYLTLRFAQNGTLEDNLGFTATCLIYSFLCALRKYLKTFFAEKIYSEVRVAQLSLQYVLKLNFMRFLIGEAVI